MIKIFVVFLSLISAPAYACCDHIENDFDKTVSEMEPFTRLVIEGEITDVRTTYPRRHPDEMDVKVLSVIDGVWSRNTLTAKSGTSSANANFDQYVVGHRYKMALIRNEEEDGSVYFTQSICGTYAKPIVH